MRGRNVLQLRHPPSNKQTLRVLIETLLHRIVDPDGVDPGGSRLHLHLRPVNAGFIIGEKPRQMQARCSPVQPQMIAGNCHQHCPHSKIHPSGGRECPHAGIDKGQARLPFLPGFKPFSVRLGRSKPLVGGVQVAELQRGFVFKLLHEMAVPVKTARKGPHGCLPRAAAGKLRTLQITLAAPGRLGYLAQRQRTECQIWRKTGAGIEGLHRRRHGSPIRLAALKQEAVQS